MVGGERTIFPPPHFVLEVVLNQTRRGREGGTHETTMECGVVYYGLVITSVVGITSLAWVLGIINNKKFRRLQLYNIFFFLVG